MSAVDESSRALNRLAIAEAAALRPGSGTRETPPKPLASVGVVGGGTMGIGIAAAFRNADTPVTLVERDAASVALAKSRLDGLYEASVKRGKLSAGQAEGRIAGVECTTSFSALGGCDLIIEAVIEDLGAKQFVFRKVEANCPRDAIIATNTSYLDPRGIAEGVVHRDRVIGLHFFSPANVMRLVEVVALPDTSEEVIESCAETCRRIGKVPVMAGICEGFIGNRMLKRYRSAAERLVRDGVSIREVDSAMREYGNAMGPFEAQDVGGLDIAFAQREAARAAGQSVKEGKQILSEGIARDASAIDLVQVLGFGFPRSRGGPMFAAGFE